MKIDNVVLSNQVISAPMAGVSDKAFRIIAREFGCGFVFTEMVSAKAILHGNKRTRALFNLEGEKKPVGVQLFGSEPDDMAEAAKIVEAGGATIIDINMGCPTPKIVKNNEGCALMLQPDRAERIIQAVVDAVSIPVTVKMRKGWDEENINCIDIALRAQRAGASLVTIHGRTRNQFYSGKADWDIIGQVVKALKIPVVGNGDIRTGQDARRMLDSTGCTGVMIARGAMGNPWIFREALRAINGLPLPPRPKPLEKIRMAKKHLMLLVKFKGEKIAVREMRKHAAWYLKGLKNASNIRNLINQLQSLEEVKSKLDEYEESFH